MLSLGRRLEVPQRAPVAAKGCPPKFPGFPVERGIIAKKASPSADDCRLPKEH